MDLGAAYRNLRDLDALIYKALGVREVSQIAATERRLRRFITAEWRSLARRAVADARRIASASSSRDKFTAAEARRVAAAVDAQMKRWPLRVSERYVDEMEDVYRLARDAAHRKGTGQAEGSLQYDTPPRPNVVVQKAAQDLPDFDLADERAVEAMSRDNRFWIGRLYSDNVSERIRDTSREIMVEQGQSRKAAARALGAALRRELGMIVTPSGWRGPVSAYLESLVANTTTVGRVQGQLRSFDDLGFEEYTIVNPMDERTCAICSHMDGKVFRVPVGIEQVEKEQSAKSPEDVRKIHPWIGEKRMKALSPLSGRRSPRGGVTALGNAGFSLPPFHFRCRCTVDVE